MEEEIPNRMDRHDQFLFYFSGHGTERQIGNKVVGYLPFFDAGEHEYSKMIGMDGIDHWDLLLEPVNHVLFVLDACFSGLAGIQGKGSPRDMKLERLSQYAHDLITAGSAKEQSFASNKWGGSLFTSAFIDGATGRADAENSDFGKDGIVSLKEIMEYISGRIDTEAAINKAIRMSPQLSILQLATVGEFFFIVQNENVPDATMASQRYGYDAPVKPSGPPPQYAAVPESLQEKFLAIQNMVEMSNGNNPPIFFVGTSKYYIEGEEYLASGLTVSPGHVRNLRQTQTGFECEAFFPGDSLSPTAKAGKTPTPGGVYQVKMRVDLQDIFLVVGKKRGGNGSQIQLL